MECRTCRELKPESEYSRSMWNRKLAGRTAECRDCKAVYMRARHEKEKEQLANAVNVVVEGEQACKRCKTPKTQDYYAPAEWRRFGAGLKGLCRKCTRHYKLRSNYAVDGLDVECMLREQRGMCAICSDALQLSEAHLDHHHASGRVRQVLCSRCNTAIGLLREDTRIMRAAIAYIERHAQ